jgi:glyoxylate reductase
LAQEVVAVTARIPEEGLRLIEKAGFELKVCSGSETLSRARLLELVKGAAAILSPLTTRIDEEVMAQAGPGLKVISAYSAGTDFIDLEAARRRGIAVTNTPGVLAQAVVEHALALLLALSCRVIEGDRLVRSGSFKGWDATLLLGADLHGKTLGLIGAGEIGGRFARACHAALGMRVVYWSRSRKPELEEECGAVFKELDELCPEADVVAPFVPLTQETRHLLSRECLSMLKPTAFVLNLSRGPVIDEAVLVERLKARQISGAALDVFEHEPRLTPGLAELENVVLAPHTGSAGRETRARMAVLAAENLIAVLQGKIPKHRVV